MIEFFSSWVKTLGLVIVIISILEMLLPNNNSKKYIRMVMGLYVLFTIISPFISNKKIFNIQDINFEEYDSKQTSSVVNQTSMNQRIGELYQEELKKDITKKLEEQGYLVKKCSVDVQISDNKEDTKITKIKIKLEKSDKIAQSTDIENKIVVEVQKIKPIDKYEPKKDDKDLEKSDIQNVKKFLIEEYEVSEKCLEIN